MRKASMSDEEYVELIRKKDRAVRRMMWVWLVLAVPFVAIFAVWARLALGGVEHLPYAAQTVVVGLVLGATMGLTCAVILGNLALCIWNFWEARVGNRTERLMLKYHDELRAKAPNSVG